jgi:hypothetical protein
MLRVVGGKGGRRGGLGGECQIRSDLVLAGRVGWV